MVALDHRGHGRGIRSRRPFRLEDCADDVAALIDQLGTGPVTAVGYSMGGPIAQLLWRRHPEVVEGLVLCATAARFSSRAELNGPVGALGYGMAMALSGVPPSLLPPRASADRCATGRPSRAWPRGRSRSGSATTRPPWSRPASPSAVRLDRWIGTIDVPTSVVVTTLDATVSPGRQWHLAQSIPGARAFPVAGDHRACVDRPGCSSPRCSRPVAASAGRARPGGRRRPTVGSAGHAARPSALEPVTGRWARLGSARTGRVPSASLPAGAGEGGSPSPAAAAHRHRA